VYTEVKIPLDIGA